MIARGLTKREILATPGVRQPQVFSHERPRASQPLARKVFVQLRVPDVRSPAFLAEARKQCQAVAASPHAAENQAFVDSVSAWRPDQDGA